jgi:hypothetical protein
MSTPYQTQLPRWWSQHDHMIHDSVKEYSRPIIFSGRIIIQCFKISHGARVDSDYTPIVANSGDHDSFSVSQVSQRLASLKAGKRCFSNLLGNLIRVGDGRRGKDAQACHLSGPWTRENGPYRMLFRMEWRVIKRSLPELNCEWGHRLRITMGKISPKSASLDRSVETWLRTKFRIEVIHCKTRLFNWTQNWTFSMQSLPMAARKITGSCAFDSHGNSESKCLPNLGDWCSGGQAMGQTLRGKSLVDGPSPREYPPRPRFRHLCYLQTISWQVFQLSEKR